MFVSLILEVSFMKLGDAKVYPEKKVKKNFDPKIFRSKSSMEGRTDKRDLSYYIQ